MTAVQQNSDRKYYFSVQHLPDAKGNKLVCPLFLLSFFVD